MTIHCGCVVLVFLTLSCLNAESWRPLTDTSELPPEAMHSSHVDNKPSGDEHHHGKRWAVLVAGSRGYDNYRHQADVCHAYQLLRKGGLRDENIIVFMYDDIAFDASNPRPGVIINRPNGDDVYEGVPKDYTGDNVTANNFYAVILGNKSALTGGSGKVVDSGPKDYIFIYYADHGSAGVVGMPTEDFVFAKDLVDVLKKKNEARSFKRMVFYLEACESGSMFEGLLPNNSNIYATTAANAEESSWATYCPRYGSPLEEYGTCLGDLYSVSWMEDSDKHDLRKETLGKQYEVVRRRTAADLDGGSHVMQYGNTKRRNDFLVSYLGTNPDNDNFTEYLSSPSTSGLVAQRDADLLHFWHKYKKAPAGSHYMLEAEKRLHGEISKRKHVDYSINRIAVLLFGTSKSSAVLGTVRPTGQPVVDDWDCFKMLVRTYEKYCGSLSKYGMKYMRALANMCNAGVTMEQMAAASVQTCSGIPPS